MASATLRIPAFAGMTGLEIGELLAKIGGDGAKIVHFSLMSTHSSRGADRS